MLTPHLFFPFPGGNKLTRLERQNASKDYDLCRESDPRLPWFLDLHAAPNLASSDQWSLRSFGQWNLCHNSVSCSGLFWLCLTLHSCASNNVSIPIPGCRLSIAMYPLLWVYLEHNADCLDRMWSTQVDERTCTFGAHHRSRGYRCSSGMLIWNASHLASILGQLEHTLSS